MFGFKRRKAALVGRMRAAATVGRLAVLSCVIAALRAPDVPEEQAQHQAAALASWILDGVPPQAARRAEIEGRARLVLNADPLLLEGAVQTIRMEAWCRFATTKTPPIPISPTLEAYGARVPDSPNPDSYPALVARLIDSLPPDLQANIRAWLASETAKGPPRS
ncbi:hypothetical protein [Dyella psychrodurans]|uniref:Uncharacterized protein n=1 Tax=Dyella psychrodurans TaxID=1927960 RepID=A0A370XBS5_9GAMM|nr:hypothetical protein [Dyella psychrodurans]RDS85873.1 hypothetical protein DWU99_00945 [Dyella psychrodurans]